MHTIYLRNPWQSEPTDDGLRWLRLFHRPTGLTDRETVWLVVSHQSVAVSLNGQRLSTSGTGLESGSGLESRTGLQSRFDITARLAERNHLSIVVDSKEAASETRAFDVWLEIDE